MFEQYEGTRDLEICRFFRRDFTALGLLINGLLITVAYIIVLLALALYNMDYLSAHFSELDIQSLIFRIIFAYVVILALYSVVVFTLRRLRYAKAKRNVDDFYDGLTELQDIYRFEDIKARQQFRGKTR